MINKSLNKSTDGFSETAVVSEYEEKGLVLLEKKIYGKYLSRPKAKILDIGCYVGRVSFPLAEKGFHIFGIDTASIAVTRADELKKKKKLKNTHFKIASATNIPFKNEVFDYVLIPYNTIEVIPSKELRIAALQEAHRTLRKNGLVLFSSLNRSYPKFFIGTAISELFKYFFRILLTFRIDKFLSAQKRISIEKRGQAESGSAFVKEKGAKKHVQCHFSVSEEINELLLKSSLELIEKIPVMNHGPQKPDADILNITYFQTIRTPVYYYICKKR